MLAREGEPANRQALAITRLTYAEHCLRRAEVLLWESKLANDRQRTWKAWSELKSLQGTSRRFKVSGRDPKATDAEAEFKSLFIDDNARKQWIKETRPPHDTPSLLEPWRIHFERAGQLLNFVDPIFCEGRGENAWRLYHLSTLARLQLFKARTIAEDAPVKALEELHWAARHLASALTNCGQWNDRRWVLVTWWDALKCYFASLMPDKSQQQTQWKRLKAQLGIKWDANWRQPNPVI